MINKKDLCLVLCYAEWCGHCEEFVAPSDKKRLGWSTVKEQIGISCTQFEEKTLNGKQPSDKAKKIDEGIVKLSSDPSADLFDFDELLKNVNGWPTLLMCIKDNNGKYTILKKYNGSRETIKNFTDFVEECIKGDKKEDKKEENKEKDELGGGNRVDYQKKYKKYKSMYADLVKKYNKLLKTN
jgi:hypothetical protein